MEAKALREPDALLQAFLHEKDAAESNDLLEKLVCEYAQPLIEQVIRAKLRIDRRRAYGSREIQDSEDISNEVTVQLIKRLSEFKSNPDGEAFSDFRSYVATAAYNACHRYLRQKYPERYRLKTRLRYILTHQKGFALWECDNKEWLCGIPAWRNQKKPFRAIEQFHQPPGSSQAIDDSPQRNGLVHLLATIFNWAGKPVALEDLVDVVASLSKIKEQEVQVDHDYEKVYDLYEASSDLPTSLATGQEQLLYLQRLWKEICELPLQQRTSLLLNLRDKQGDDIITLLAHLRIASLRQMAEVLAMSAEEMAQLWNELPLDDATIAKRLGVTRQQVINFRQSARRRLLRRAKSFEMGKEN